MKTKLESINFKDIIGKKVFVEKEEFIKQDYTLWTEYCNFEVWEKVLDKENHIIVYEPRIKIIKDVGRFKINM